MVTEVRPPAGIMQARIPAVSAFTWSSEISRFLEAEFPRETTIMRSHDTLSISWKMPVCVVTAGDCSLPGGITRALVIGDVFLDVA